MAEEKQNGKQKAEKPKPTLADVKPPVRHLLAKKVPPKGALRGKPPKR